jgi:DNA-binding transcriptional LysR family regulator
LPCFLARRDRTVEPVLPTAPAELDDLWLVVHADVQRTARVRAVIEAVEARLAQVGGELSSSAR